MSSQIKKKIHHEYGLTRALEKSIFRVVLRNNVPFEKLLKK